MEVSSFRRLLNQVSDELHASDVEKIANIYGLNDHSTSLTVLRTLEKRGVISHEQPELLVKLLEDISRYDVINTYNIRDAAAPGNPSSGAQPDPTVSLPPPSTLTHLLASVPASKPEPICSLKPLSASPEGIVKEVLAHPQLRAEVIHQLNQGSSLPCTVNPECVPNADRRSIRANSQSLSRPSDVAMNPTRSSSFSEMALSSSTPTQRHTSASSSSETWSSGYGSQESSLISSPQHGVPIDDHHMNSPSRGVTSLARQHPVNNVIPPGGVVSLPPGPSNDAGTHSTGSQLMTSSRESSPSEVNQPSMQMVSTSFRSSVDEPGKEVVWKIETASIRKVISKRLDKTFSKELSLKDGTSKGNRPVKLKFKLHSNGIGHDCNNSITLQVQVVVDRKYQHLFELTRLDMKVTIVIGKDEQPEFIAVREVTQQELKDFTMHDFLPHEVLDSMQAKHMELMMDAHLTYDIKPVTPCKLMEFEEDGIIAIQ